MSNQVKVINTGDDCGNLEVADLVLLDGELCLVLEIDGDPLPIKLYNFKTKSIWWTCFPDAGPTQRWVDTFGEKE